MAEIYICVPWGKKEMVGIIIGTQLYHQQRATIDLVEEWCNKGLKIS